MADRALIATDREITGSVPAFNRFDNARKSRFLAIARDFWPNLGKICEAVGIDRTTVYLHRKSDPAFNKALLEIDQQVCDQMEAVLREQGTQPKGFLDRISYLRAHRPELYDRAKVVKIEGYKMTAGEKQTRLGAVETVLDAEISKAYLDRKERREQRKQKQLSARSESASEAGAGGAK